MTQAQVMQLMVTGKKHNELANHTISDRKAKGPHRTTYIPPLCHQTLCAEQEMMMVLKEDQHHQ